MKRLAQAIRLRPEKREEYLRLHSAVWPAVETALLASNIRNYSIFLRADTLFGYFEYHGEDFEADMARLDADPQTQDWWKLTDPCQEPWSDSERQWSGLSEIWHLNETRQS
ncbi:L-rhamnose mutarotase [Streptacidiphilus sp. EB103A]|jgi:L-rhamnose mutarotase|uniref:L-rhamnose mutarotase n=1 Tax=Streptacidiphilus sp. EB103A TaxID=3156275 RepID=UPI0035176EE1